MGALSHALPAGPRCRGVPGGAPAGAADAGGAELNERLTRSARRFALVALLAAACASPAVTAGQTSVEPGPAEQELRAQAGREAAQLDASSKLYDDPLLDAYLARIIEKLSPDVAPRAEGPALKVTVVRDPTLNAFALPDGRIYVHTGLLAGLESEAQLAMILGHEMTHVSNRQALALSRAAAGRPSASTIVASAASIGLELATDASVAAIDGIGTAALSATAATIFGRGLPLVAETAIYGRGDQLERDADAGGMDRLVRAGYDPKEATRAFDALRRDLGSRGSLEIFFFGHRQRLAERAATTAELVRTYYAAAAAAPDTVRTTDEFGLRMSAVVRENARLDIQAGRFALAAEQLDRVLASAPRDPVAHLYYGDLHRLRSQRAQSVAEGADWTRQAIDRYESAARLDPAFADPFRQLGLLYYQQQEIAQARAAFQQYLTLEPAAPDAERVADYLTELDD
jgi:predicted Zn-dependent protease